MRNRNERLAFNPDGPGAKCEGEFTRSLHLCNVFPSTGRWLMQRALRDWPVSLREEPVAGSQDRPEISFIIGHRGRARLPHLLATLRSIAGQEGVSFECIVVEQDLEAMVRDCLPAWVRYIHTPLPQRDMPYCRSWAFNVGALSARGDLLILHDNDLVIPAAYAFENVRWRRQAYEVVILKRFILYLDAASTAGWLTSSLRRSQAGEVEAAVENSLGGGSMAIAKDAYVEIGGMDEDFIGWGGEDNEFWDRCLTRKVYDYAYLPAIHLCHEPQPGKRAVDGNGFLTAELTARRRAIPPAERIAELTRRSWGDASGPTAETASFSI
jgi:hypothetical protein